MRGKSIDTEFVASFVQECAAKEKNSPEEICEEAIAKINEIDKQLKLRLKLTDVLSFFKYKKKLVTEKEIISFDNINKIISKDIFSFLNETQNCIENDFINYISNKSNKLDLICNYKQLLQVKVLQLSPRAGSYPVIQLGENYEFFKSQIQ